MAGDDAKSAPSTSSISVLKRDDTPLADIDARQLKAEHEEDGADADADRRVGLEQLRRDPAGIAAGQRREQRGSGDEADAGDQPGPRAGEPARGAAHRRASRAHS